MLFSEHKRIVLFTPPKCGTLMLHRVLTQRGCKAVLAPQFDGGVGEHTTLLPFDVWRDVDRWTFAVAVRNPYTRALSLYGHYKRYWQQAELEFPAFLRRIVLAPRHLFFNATISALLTPAERPLDGRRPIRVSATVRLEHAVADLRGLGFDVPDELPRVHALGPRSLDEYVGDAQELVELWAAHDFERFGYERSLDATG